jgi:hypothetical protein
LSFSTENAGGSVPCFCKSLCYRCLYTGHLHSEHGQAHSLCSALSMMCPPCRRSDRLVCCSLQDLGSW